MCERLFLLDPAGDFLSNFSKKSRKRKILVNLFNNQLFEKVYSKVE